MLNLGLLSTLVFFTWLITSSLIVFTGSRRLYRIMGSEYCRRLFFDREFKKLDLTLSAITVFAVGYYAFIGLVYEEAVLLVIMFTLFILFVGFALVMVEGDLVEEAEGKCVPG